MNMGQKTPIINKGDWRTLVSPRRDLNRPRYNWYMFKHSYSKDLVNNILDEFKINSGYVLDPFCGGGTTLLACKERGLNSVGYDIMPFSVFISNVKSLKFDPAVLKKVVESFEAIETGEQLPDIQIIDKAFTPSVKKAILGIRGWINTLPEQKSQEFFLLALLTILDKVSKAVKSGGFLRIVEKNTSYDQTISLFRSAATKMIQDVETNPLDSDATAEAFLGDARQLPTNRKYDFVITSPPYPNRHDYTRVYALELLTAFINSNDELKQLRYRTLRSHVEAKKTFTPEGYEPPPYLKGILSKLEKKELNNNTVLPMLSGYFEDMYLALKEIKKNLKKGGKVAMVVSNVRYAGLAVPVDKILSKIGAQAGLNEKDILVARTRGNSAQQMKKYSRQPSRESIIIWENSN